MDNHQPPTPPSRQARTAGIVVAWTVTAIAVAVILAVGVRLIMWVWP